jgi:hypothetical protein
MARVVRFETDAEGQVDRRVSIEDVFEHVIEGLRLSLLLRMIRETGADTVGTALPIRT